jgi:phosphatidylinositol alpha-1,6-mannosyltransferase
VRSVLVTNDFPPKVGGIQSYLWELWRRLPEGLAGVLTTSYEGSDAFDASQAYPIRRVDASMMYPTRAMRREIEAVIEEWRPEAVILDPALPVGALGPGLSCPYGVVLHGAEITVYARIPATRPFLKRVLRRASGAVAAGGYPARQALGLAPGLRGVVIPPGVDHRRFHPLTSDERSATRVLHGLDPDTPLVLGVSRLVPRKGFDVLIDAVSGLPDVHLAIAGDGRDRGRLEARVAKRGIGGRTHFLGRIPEPDLPSLYGCADVFAMLCRNRWAGTEQEGFGIVFLEAAACGVPQIAGRSGGADEAVLDGETGYVVEPRDAATVRHRIEALLGDDELRRAMGEASRARAVEAFDYDHLVEALIPVADGRFDALGPLHA